MNDISTSEKSRPEFQKPTSVTLLLRVFVVTWLAVHDGFVRLDEWIRGDVNESSFALASKHTRYARRTRVTCSIRPSPPYTRRICKAFVLGGWPNAPLSILRTAPLRIPHSHRLSKMRAPKHHAFFASCHTDVQ